VNQLKSFIQIGPQRGASAVYHIEDVRQGVNDLGHVLELLFDRFRQLLDFLDDEAFFWKCTFNFNFKECGPKSDQSYWNVPYRSYVRMEPNRFM